MMSCLAVFRSALLGVLVLASSAVDARTYVIEYYGDSTIWGYASGSDGQRVGRPAPKVFAELLARRIKADVRNQGVNGSTACSLLEGTDGRHAAWNEQMAASRAHFVILNHAINDQWKHDVAAYGNCLRRLAQVARKHGKQVVFETPNPTRDSGAGGLDVYVEVMKEVARQESVPVIDQYGYLTKLLQGREPRVLAPDGLHPSEAVYELKGKFAAQAFIRLFGL